MEAAFWDQRYAGESYFYGEAPNAFVAEHAALIPPGPVLCLAEGEGRNAVFLAGRGHAVTAMDQSSVGLHKARQLAAQRGVTLTTEVADLSTYPIRPGHWSGIVATFVHLPPDLRRAVHAAVVAGLRPGGVYLLEAYHPDQLQHGTGGPRDINLLMTLADLRHELGGLAIIHGRELERPVVEGHAHTGLAAVVQVVARQSDKPGL
jgi:hypothetical protein